MLKIWSQLLTRQLQSVLDLTTLVGAFVFAFLLRFDFAIPPDWRHPMIFQLPYVVLVQFAALGLIGSHSFIWRYVGLAEIKSFVYAIAGSAASFMLLRIFLPDQAASWNLP